MDTGIRNILIGLTVPGAALLLFIIVYFCRCCKRYWKSRQETAQRQTQHESRRKNSLSVIYQDRKDEKRKAVFDFSLPGSSFHSSLSGSKDSSENGKIRIYQTKPYGAQENVTQPIHTIKHRTLSDMHSVIVDVHEDTGPSVSEQKRKIVEKVFFTDIDLVEPDMLLGKSDTKSASRFKDYYYNEKRNEDLEELSIDKTINKSRLYENVSSLNIRSASDPLSVDHDTQISKFSQENLLPNDAEDVRKRVSLETQDEVELFDKASNISHQALACSRMSLIYDNEEVNVHGQVSLGQIAMLAQHFYTNLNNNNCDLLVEHIQTWNNEKNVIRTLSSSLIGDWRDTIVTSLLFNEPNEMWFQKKGVFIHKMVGPTGGKLSVSGVTIEIPPNALEAESLITLGILWHEGLAPTLQTKQTLLSPIVLCQPCGLKFKSPVRLSFPHAAVNVSENWNMTILKREGSVLQTTDWDSVTETDCEETNIEDHHITLLLHHFTLYTCVGERKPGATAAKLVHIVAFGKLQKGTYFKPKIYCLNKYDKELEEVNKIEDMVNNGSRIVDTTDLIVHDNEEDVVVEMAKVSSDWTLKGEGTEILPFEQIWHAFHPHCTFALKPKCSSVMEVDCEVKAYQKKEHIAAKLKIFEMISEVSSPISRGPLAGAEDSLIRELILFLDPETPTCNAGNWKNLAEKMECDWARIRWLEGQKLDSPTKFLLDEWRKEGRTYNDLEQVMIDINREDAAEEIRNYLNRLPT